MATLELVNFKQLGPAIEQANLSDIVGVGGLNEKMDVMLIQALFKLIGFSEQRARKNFGVGLTDLPETEGKFDSEDHSSHLGISAQERHQITEC